MAILVIRCSDFDGHTRLSITVNIRERRRAASIVHGGAM